jgi:hypothetical protein
MASSSPTSPVKRPRLSLQIRAISSDPTTRNSRVLAAAVDVKDHATFNTLSNVYAAVIDRSTPTGEKPSTNILSGRPSLRLQTQTQDAPRIERKMQSPYLGPYLDTPLSAQPSSPAILAELRFPSAMTATPPMSAGPVDPSTPAFSFEGFARPADSSKDVREIHSARPTRRAATLPSGMVKAPYSHPRSLKSILRNSPLPALKKTASPISPRRQSLRLQERAARRVAYNSPLCQTIENSRYTRSHMDLLSGDESPYTPGSASDGSTDSILDTTMAYTGDETLDGGQTPGPFEEMRRRLAGMKTTSPLSPSGHGAIRKRKKKEKKRRWVWTICEDEENNIDSSPVSRRWPAAMAENDTTPTSASVAASQRPRTRLQTSLEVPIIAAPIPPTPRGAGPKVSTSPVKTAISVPLIAIPAPRPRTRLQTLQNAPQVHPVSLAIQQPDPQLVMALPSSLVSPPPLTRELSVSVEPLTPSIASTTSQDSVFERAGGQDTEMSDISSFASETDHLLAAELEDGDDEMDTETPTVAVTENPFCGYLANTSASAMMMAEKPVFLAPPPPKRIDSPVPGLGPESFDEGFA